MHLRSSVVLLLLVSASRGEAQEATDAPRGWAYGVSLGVPRYRGTVDSDFFLFSANFTHIHLNRLGADIAVGTMPSFVSERVFPVGARAAVALPVAPASHLLVIPSAGVSGIGGGSPGGLAGLAGFHAGVATIVHGDGIGLRTGVSWLYFHGLQWRPVVLFEFGIVVVPANSSF
jgi:hypothetical protein